MAKDSPEERARQRANEYVGLLWHIASYIVVVPFLFFLDWHPDSRIDWAYWVAIPWAIGLLFHVFAYTIEERLKESAYERFLAQEKAKQKDKKA